MVFAVILEATDILHTQRVIIWFQARRMKDSPQISLSLCDLMSHCHLADYKVNTINPES